MLAAAEAALALEPGLAAAHVARGVALVAQGRLVEAEEAYGRAIALEPDNDDAHYALGRLCFQQGRMEDAARLFRRAAGLRPGDIYARASLIGIENGLGQIEKSLATARLALGRAELELERHPESGRRPTRRRRRWRPWAIGEGALRFAARALALEPNDHPVQYNVACTYSVPGRDRAGPRRPRAHHAGCVRPSLGLDGAGRRPRPAARASALRGARAPRARREWGGLTVAPFDWPSPRPAVA